MSAPEPPRILVAGIGNIFLGDDAFGSEVARRLARRPQPAGVEVVDFGIRGVDLTYALLRPLSAAVLVDASRLGEEPGTLCVVEPDPADLPEIAPGQVTLEAHALDPARALSLVRAMGGTIGTIRLVACEPETFGDEDEGRMGLSAVVEAAIDPAVDLVESLVRELLSSLDEPSAKKGKVPGRA